MVLHIWCFEGPNIFLFRSLTIIIFICTEFLCSLHRMTYSLFLGKNKILTYLPITSPFIHEWKAIPKTRSGKNAALILFNFFKRFCILNSTSSSIHLSKACITVERVGNAKDLLNRIFCKRNKHFLLQNLMCVEIIMKIRFFHLWLCGTSNPWKCPTLAPLKSGILCAFFYTLTCFSCLPLHLFARWIQV